ncbi:MAG: sensor histidine kinase [Lachnospiraceae bacterium]|nr:sensor histidine kinase [Lachnospiraceae bacterium]
MSFIRHSFKRKLFFIILSVTLILVVCGGIMTIQGFQARIKVDHERDDRVQESVIGGKLETALQASETALNRIGASETLKNSLNPGYRMPNAIYAALYDISSEIRDFATVELYLGGTGRYSTGRGETMAEYPEDYSFIAEAERSEGEIIYAMDPYDLSESGSALIMVKKISDGDPAGFAVVRISQDSLKGLLTGSFNARDGFMLTDRFFHPFCLIGTAEDRQVLNKVRKNLFAGDLYNKGIDENVYISDIGTGGLTGIYITPPPFEASAVRAGYQIVLMQVVISILLCLFVASRMSISFSKPINILSVAMKRFRKGDFDTKIELNREDEFGQLATGFNKMTAQLKDTIRERVEAERRVNDARIEMMQSQLNPHFLYNTLDTIKWVAKANQVPEVATLSSSLAAILRTGISENRFCKLENELELVKNYCDIQKIRFDDFFDLETDVPGDLMEAYVPKLILQPVVENAIIHGLEGRSDGHISIEAHKESASGDKENLVLTVSDNGKGISDEMIKLVESADPEALKGHLGFNNINTIIKLYYGKEFGIRAERLTEGGTKITLVLPFSAEEPDNGGETV